MNQTDQDRFTALAAKEKANTLTPEERKEYDRLATSQGATPVNTQN